MPNTPGGTLVKEMSVWQTPEANISTRTSPSAGVSGTLTVSHDQLVVPGGEGVLATMAVAEGIVLMIFLRWGG